MKSRQRVAVVLVKIRAVIVMKARVTRSEIKLASTTTMALVMTTLYTDTPMYCESLSRYFYVARLPGHIDTHHKKKAFVGVQDTQPRLRVLRTANFNLK